MRVGVHQSTLIRDTSKSKDLVDLEVKRGKSVLYTGARQANLEPREPPSLGVGEMAFAGVQAPSSRSSSSSSSSSSSGAVREALRHIRVRSYASLNPRTGDVQSATGYFTTKKGKRVCQLFFAMNSRTQDLWKGKSEGLTFWCPPYQFDSVWMKDTLFLTERSDRD